MSQFTGKFTKQKNTQKILKRNKQTEEYSDMGERSIWKLEVRASLLACRHGYTRPGRTNPRLRCEKVETKFYLSGGWLRNWDRLTDGTALQAVDILRTSSRFQHGALYGVVGLPVVHVEPLRVVHLHRFTGWQRLRKRVLHNVDYIFTFFTLLWEFITQFWNKNLPPPPSFLFSM